MGNSVLSLLRVPFSAESTCAQKPPPWNCTDRSSKWKQVTGKLSRKAKAHTAQVSFSLHPDLHDSFCLRWQHINYAPDPAAKVTVWVQRQICPFQSNSLSPAVLQTPVSNLTLCPRLLPPRLVPKVGDGASPQSPVAQEAACLRSGSRRGTEGQAC